VYYSVKNMWTDMDEMTRWGSTVKRALVLVVVVSFGCFCYSAGYTNGRSEGTVQMDRTSQSVLDALRRLGATVDGDDAVTLAPAAPLSTASRR
jgi:hypothetical protein